MATNYGAGISSSHGKLTYNGVDYRQLNNKALQAMSAYMKNYNAPKWGGGKWSNWIEEQNKISRELKARGSSVIPDLNTRIALQGSAPRTAISPEAIQELNRANAAAVLQSAAPELQTLQSANGDIASRTSAVALSGASRQYANLIARQRNLSQLGV